MPRFSSRSYTVVAYRFMGTASELPMSFAEHVLPQRAGMACLVRCGNEVRPCELGDWMVRGSDGRMEVIPNGSFDQRFEALPDEGVGGYISGITATFMGDPKGIAHEQPSSIPWLGYIFPRGVPVPVNDPQHIETLKLNSHFIVTDPADELEPESEPAVAEGQTGTLTLNRKAQRHG